MESKNVMPPEKAFDMFPDYLDTSFTVLEGERWETVKRMRNGVTIPLSKLYTNDIKSVIYDSLQRPYIAQDKDGILWAVDLDC